MTEHQIGLIELEALIPELDRVGLRLYGQAGQTVFGCSEGYCSVLVLPDQRWERVSAQSAAELVNALRGRMPA